MAAARSFTELLFWQRAGKWGKRRDSSMIIGRRLTQRRKDAKKVEGKRTVGMFMLVFETPLSRTPLRLGAFA
jgi:hypothetical protein